MSVEGAFLEQLGEAFVFQTLHKSWRNATSLVSCCAFSCWRTTRRRLRVPHVVRNIKCSARDDDGSGACTASICAKIGPFCSCRWCGGRNQVSARIDRFGSEKKKERRESLEKRKPTSFSLPSPPPPTTTQPPPPTPGSAPDRRQLYLGRLYAYKTTLKVKVHAASPRHQLAVQLFRFVSDEAAASAGSMSLPTFIACTSVVCAKWTAPTRWPCSSTPAPSATVNWGNWSNFNGAVAAPRFRSNIVALK